eukprot:TRINITY_DN1596_c0_g1_i1.p1 TRINITY_DN1596_c0_g1~~TRINITY_DN1596_c0_g1_i1.p1  ORF type:complete len:114 (-),score=6.28 TRINITY_DN1596_c0_g1_i1:415-756(-)
MVKCNSYFGCATNDNQVKWALFIIMFFGGIALAFLSYYERMQCYNTFGKGVQANDRDLDMCYYQHSYLTVEAIICWVVCSLPLYLMCCCTEKPEENLKPETDPLLTPTAATVH